MRISVRTAGPLDCRPMAALLNEIIAEGGTTAIIRPVAPEDLRDWMARARDRAAWHLAEDEAGTVMGFQWIEPADYLPDEAAEIATFARQGRSGLGIGSSLFRATEQAARALGYRWINANIRADNTGGLAYYQSRGFEEYGRKTGVPLGNGQLVDKVLKRYDL
ncbi:GNAT family N-acetyltransferase [Antarctobacter heliothermus]|uniref:L-amino acid N-acyltransferase YncA n=1 Tax=Antarctobacter heliothermus TaxID=74033 RepID=A0A239BQM3_9RHOB|nr:GNAT family N-acetyltransferase [Antarctobacter heliothermus]SNS09364.1 L-amino acid N-acyltransferase YncA [Antarctobacter heliothermus]